MGKSWVDGRGQSKATIYGFTFCWRLYWFYFMSSRRIWSQRVSFHLFRRTKPSDASLPNTSPKTGPSSPKDWPPNVVPKKEQANNAARGNPYPNPDGTTTSTPPLRKKDGPKKTKNCFWLSTKNTATSGLSSPTRWLEGTLSSIQIRQQHQKLFLLNSEKKFKENGKVVRF